MMLSHQVAPTVMMYTAPRRYISVRKRVQQRRYTIYPIGLPTAPPARPPHGAFEIPFCAVALQVKSIGASLPCKYPLTDGLGCI